MSGPQLLARSVSRLTASVLGRKQPDLAGLIAAWPEVVGTDWAGRCAPVAYRKGSHGQGGGTLELAVTAGAALLVQHETSVLIERINGFLGRGAVSQLRLKNLESPPAPVRATRTRHLTPLQVEGIDDPELAALLGRLGAAIRDSQQRR